MSTSVDATGQRYVVCSGCGAEGPRRVGDRAARAAAREAGWARSYPRGRGEDFFCPSCRCRGGEIARPPRSPNEWQEAVDLAQLMLSIDSARKYGFLDGGPKIDAQRCSDILRVGRNRGFRPKAIDQLVGLYLREASNADTG